MAKRYFKSREKNIKVGFNGLAGIPAPEFVNRARKRFSFDEESGILQKQCSNCLKWFPVAQLSNEGNWVDIHREEEVHDEGNSYRSDCSHCYQEKRTAKVGKDVKLSSADKPVNSDKPSNSEPQKVSVSLYSWDRKYLKICAASMGTTIGGVLTELIEKDRKARKIDY